MFTCNESSYSPKRTLLTPQARISEQHLTVSNARMRRGSEIKPLTCSSSCLANVSFSTTDDNQWHCEGALMARRTTCYECFILWTWLTTTESRAALVGTSSCSRRRYLGETISCARNIVAWTMYRPSDSRRKLSDAQLNEQLDAIFILAVSTRCQSSQLESILWRMRRKLKLGCCGQYKYFRNCLRLVNLRKSGCIKLS